MRGKEGWPRLTPLPSEGGEGLLSVNGGGKRLRSFQKKYEKASYTILAFMIFKLTSYIYVSGTRGDTLVRCIYVQQHLTAFGLGTIWAQLNVKKRLVIHFSP